jgi:hypothetical protein
MQRNFELARNIRKRHDRPIAVEEPMGEIISVLCGKMLQPLTHRRIGAEVKCTGIHHLLGKVDRTFNLANHAGRA